MKRLLPPILLDFYSRYKNRKYGWKGDYKSWKDAKDASTGYETSEIILKVKESLLKVKKGDAVYERDSLLFDEIHYSWPLLAGLMFASANSNGKLEVLDFGGSLGSTYFQNKKFLDRFDNLSWSIVEQKHFVDVGQSEFEDYRLKFYHNLESCIKHEKPNILILSAVLHYIEKPYELLHKILKNDFDTILVDRTPFSKTNKKIKLQTVHPSIYKGSYPCWFFDELEFINFFEKNNYIIIESFEAKDDKSEECNFKGFIIQKNEINA
tara:strand:+ start:3368 stop:4165 length:798 start_codon:yes stop_codon:yes gene_type:complete